MKLHEAGELRYYTFDLFDQYGLPHGVFTRHGGVSPQPWASLNQGGTVGDARDHVVENRRRMFAALGRSVESLFDAWQVHGTETICTNVPRPLDQPHEKADAILTDRPEITLFMRFADCVPIYLFDPVKKVVGQVHAGWRGTVDRATAAAIRQMQARYGSRPEDLVAAIGPSICVEHYEIGQSQETVGMVHQAFGGQAESVLPRVNGAIHFDLWKANQMVLEETGVREIELAGICTACHNEDWFSHRAEKGKTGRFGALLAL